MINAVNVTRPSLIGDIICSLVFSTSIEKNYPGSVKIALIDFKCQQVAPLLINAPNIDGVRITEKPDQITQDDEDYFKKFDLIFDPFAPIVKENWYNEMTVIESIFKMNWLRGMSGPINPQKWNQLDKDERCPRLTQYFDAPKNNYITIWANSGYSNDPINRKRNPSKEYWTGLVDRLIKEDYKVAQLGTCDHFLINEKVLDLRHLSLFEAIRFSLGSQVAIGTDSGSMHCLGAYGFNQILLTTYWRRGHFQNPSALIPVNYKNHAINLFCPDDINKIEYDRIIEGIKLLNE